MGKSGIRINSFGIFAAVLAFVSISSGANLTVPTEYANLKLAVSSAVAGDIITMEAGIYSGSNNTGIDLSSKTLSFLGNGEVIIDLESKNRAFYTLTNATLHFSNINFRNGIANVPLGANQEKSGGSLFFFRGGMISIENCRFENSAAPNGMGGAIFVDNPTGYSHNLTLNQAVFVNCTSDEDGGAVWSNQASWQFVGGSFTGCTASGSGGALFASNDDSNLGALMMSFDSVDLIGNMANVGGAIYAQDPTTISVSNSQLTSNVGSQGGGAFRITSSSYLIMSNSSCNMNRATDSFGGCAYLDGPAGIASDGSQYDWNVAVQGGALYVAGGPVKFVQSSINGNSAVRGGGLLLTVRTKATFTSTDIMSNNATEKGGAIYLDAQCTLIVNGESRIQDNRAGQGGAFSCSDSKITITDSDIASNTAGLDPVVFCDTQPALTVCNIMGNSAFTGHCVQILPSSRLSTAALAGVIVGVVIGVVVLTSICVFLVWHFDLKKRIKEGKIWKAIVGDDDVVLTEEGIKTEKKDEGEALPESDSEDTE